MASVQVGASAGRSCRAGERMSTLEFHPINYYMATSVVLCVLMCAASPLVIISWAHDSSQERPCQEPEKSALLAFYRFSGFDGLDAMWPSANRTMYCACEWFGVECDEQGFIVALDLYDPESPGMSSFNLNTSVGNIVPWPRLLAPLRFLEELSMHGFYHASPLPQEVGLLSQSLTTLVLSDCELLPPLPAEALSNLSKLTTLHISNYGGYQSYTALLGSPIPHQICNISSLQYLDLSTNWYTANIPPCIGSLPFLSHLDLSQNTLQGSIPDQIWIGAASNLTYLDLSENFLSGQISSTVSAAKNLSFLNLKYNNLQGSIPDESMGELLQLTSLDLSNNNFTGSIPASLGNLTRLFSLDLSSNSFTGAIPASLGNLTNLTYLILGNNLLSGTIPHQLGNLCNLYVNIDLSRNQLSGRIPISLGFNRPKCIMDVDLSSNNLTGALPWTLLTSRAISTLDVHSNYITGITAYDSKSTFALQSAANTSGLTSLDLSHNHLKGAIPSLIGHLSTLESLSVSGNFLQSASFQDFKFPNFTGLSSLRLASNNIQDIPSWLSQQSYLEWIDLSANKLEGTIPPWFWSILSLVEFVDLSWNRLRGDIRLDALCTAFRSGTDRAFKFDGSHNNFTRFQLGNLPYNSSRCTPLDLNLDSNQLSGLLPWHAASNVTNNVFWYNSLSLADNLFSGTLPEFPHIVNVDFSTVDHLLDLSRNLLSGTIPTSISSLGVSKLRLSFNNFSGEIPSSFCTNPERLGPFFVLPLSVLELDSNSLGGSIPHELGLCNESLKYVVLRDNMLTGFFPEWEQISNFPGSLEVLDLSYNHLQGGIPGWVLQMQSLSSLILSHNTFSGALPVMRSTPTQLSSLPEYLQLLDLSYNHLQGGIPGWVLQLKSLRVLILRHNAFSGALPAMRWNTTQLQVLDLSSNKLGGGIPSHSLSLLQGFRYNSTSWASNDTLSGQSITIQGKGGETTFVYVLKATVALDLSENALTGAIPEELGRLDGLTFLNLSHNRLSGAIPDSLGELRQLTSLDLSGNELEGEIPANALCPLTFLGVVNLSHNELRGPIPQCGQWSTFSGQSFLGNSGLCGPQSEQQQSCNADQYSPSAPSADNNDDEDNHEFWLGILVGLCATFPVVFWLSILWGPIQYRISKASTWVLLKFRVYHL